jgi:hypothetical protein
MGDCVVQELNYQFSARRVREQRIKSGTIFYTEESD